MNHAHLQNGVGMGRGMAPNMQQAQGQNTIHRHIITSLQNQGPYTGWQAAFPVEKRAMQVKLLIDSLRLIQPIIELPKAVQVALSFENKAFVQSPTPDAYISMCREKLSQIQDTRKQQQSNANAQHAPNQNNSMQQAQQIQQMQQMGQNLNFPP